LWGEHVVNFYPLLAFKFETISALPTTPQTQCVATWMRCLQTGHAVRYATLAIVPESHPDTIELWKSGLPYGHSYNHAFGWREVAFLLDIAGIRAAGCHVHFLH
jgi:hypothetical protein